MAFLEFLDFLEFMETSKVVGGWPQPTGDRYLLWGLPYRTRRSAGPMYYPVLCSFVLGGRDPPAAAFLVRRQVVPVLNIYLYCISDSWCWIPRI